MSNISFVLLIVAVVWSAVMTAVLCALGVAGRRAATVTVTVRTELVRDRHLPPVRRHRTNRRTCDRARPVLAARH